MYKELRIFKDIGMPDSLSGGGIFSVSISKEVNKEKLEDVLQRSKLPRLNKWKKIYENSNQIIYEGEALYIVHEKYRGEDIMSVKIAPYKLFKTISRIDLFGFLFAFFFFFLTGITLLI